jgi:hypothetical protein
METRIDFENAMKILCAKIVLNSWTSLDKRMEVIAPALGYKSRFYVYPSSSE